MGRRNTPRPKGSRLKKVRQAKKPTKKNSATGQKRPFQVHSGQKLHEKNGNHEDVQNKIIWHSRM